MRVWRRWIGRFIFVSSVVRQTFALNSQCKLTQTVCYLSYLLVYVPCPFGIVMVKTMKDSPDRDISGLGFLPDLIEEQLRSKFYYRALQCLGKWSTLRYYIPSAIPRHATGEACLCHGCPRSLQRVITRAWSALSHIVSTVTLRSRRSCIRLP